jgi:putative phosphoesterase
MLIGVISDTHDNVFATKKAIDLFNEKGVGFVIHAGDFTSPFTLKVFKELNCNYVGIFGNNDGDKLLLFERSEGTIHNQPYIVTLNGKKIIVLHEHHIVDALADSGHFDLLIYGHTHMPDIRKVGKTLVINPGEAGSWLYGKSTVALVDLDTMEAEIIEL